MLIVGFKMGKESPYSSSLWNELARNMRFVLAYIKGFIATIIPAYARHLQRKRLERHREYLASLQTIEYADWIEDKKESNGDS